METITFILLSVLILGFFFIVGLGILILLFLFIKDKNQEQHAILRRFPVIGRVRYIMEKISPEIKDYFGDRKQPFSKDDMVTVVKRSKYLTNMTAFGTDKDFDEGGYFLKNSMYPVREEDMKVNKNDSKVNTKVYKVDKDGLFSRKEHSVDTVADRYLLADEDAIIIGENTSRYPFVLKGQVGMSAMSYGSLGKNAIRTFSHGLGIAGGSWMNTGEGGISEYHLESGVDLLAQIGPGLYGYRDKEGNFDWTELKMKSMFPQVKAFELKLAQGAKIMGGRLPGSKVTPEIAEIRGVEPWKDVDSPIRFKEFNNDKEMLEFINKIREVTGKPVGIKIVMGGEDSLDNLIKEMVNLGIHPDFITVDSSSGGSGKAPKSHMNALGIEVKSALPVVDKKLREAGLRDDIKIIASGKLIHSERIAVALCLGADLVATSRGVLFSGGCVLYGECDKNSCISGIATTDPKLQKALVVDEKKYRVANYILSLREELFSLASACGIDSPAKFSKENLTFVSRDYKIKDVG